MPFRELMRVLRRVLRYVTPYWGILSLAVVMTFIVTFTKLSQAKFISFMFGLMADKTSVQLDPNNPFAHNINGHDPLIVLDGVCVLFLAAMAAMGVATFCSRYLINLAGQRALRDFRLEVFAHIQRLPLVFFDSMELGAIQARASGDVTMATQLYVQLADFFTNLLLVVVALSWMLYHDWKMTAMVFLLSPLIGTAVSVFGGRIGRVTADLQAKAADLSAIAYESISSIKVVKAYTREQHEVDRFGVKNDESYHIQMGLTKASASQPPVVEFLSAFGIAAIVWYGAFRIIHDGIKFQQMTEYWTLLVMTTQPISALSGLYSSFQSSAAAAQRVFYVLDSPLEVTDETGCVELPPIKGEIELERVSFSYEALRPELYEGQNRGPRYIFNELNLTIAPGEVIAIVGGNGAGKTSLVNLVSRFYTPQSGRVLVDGHDISRVKLRSLRSQVGVVIQESVLFAGTVAENIACGGKFTTEEILAASKLANVDQFAQTLEGKYDYQVGERGQRLSGGQRQRIAIARALIRNPSILILDEFTSGIDAESENLITDAIQNSMKGRTCLVIAHRLNTIRHADRILVLDGGEIVEQGSHDALMELDGRYARIFQAQLRAPSPLVLSPGNGTVEKVETAAVA